jgi:alpha-N-arabinofuranosidase
MRTTRIAAAAVLLSLGAMAQARTLHVSTTGSDANAGTQAAPLRTIEHAAELAEPGDVITVHAGTYRERVNPPRGGISDTKRIVYQAAPGERVTISGAEPAKHWERVQGGVWKTTLPNSFFGRFNPYSDTIHGDWFNAKGRAHHTGQVYLNGNGLAEAASLAELMKPTSSDSLWFGEVDAETTTIWAQFGDVDPNGQNVEINVRQTVFYPEKTGINYITVRGFTLEDAATPWAPPTAEQMGVIGPHWSKGWIIENNVVRNSICAGISLGKYGDQWDNTSANSAEGYVLTVRRALSAGWSGAKVGHHVVRNNTIEHCGQAGIVGSLGAVSSTISGNTIHDINLGQSFSGAEMAGIKLHGAVDVTITGNHIYRASLGLWLDWMAQGTRVSRNLFDGNGADVFVEVDHGPFLFANNLLLSQQSLHDSSQGGAYVHNLFAGTVFVQLYDKRQTPFLMAHSTAVAGLHDNPSGDNRYYNNVFVKRADLSLYDKVSMPMYMDGNVYLDGAKPSKWDKDAVVRAEADPRLAVEETNGGAELSMQWDPAWAGTQKRPLVTSALLGKAAIPNLPYEQPDGEAVRVDTDYFGARRDAANPMPGPFERLNAGAVRVKVW